MIDVTISEGRLNVRLTGWDRIWALKRQLSIPVEHIESIELDVDGARSNTWKGLRLPGTHLPGVVVAGSFWWKDGWTFWSVRRSSQRVLIFLRNERYHRLVLQVAHPEEVIAVVRAAIPDGPTASAG